MAHGPCIFIEKDKEKITLAAPALDTPDMSMVTWLREITLGVRSVTDSRGGVEAYHIRFSDGQLAHSQTAIDLAGVRTPFPHHALHTGAAFEESACMFQSPRLCTASPYIPEVSVGRYGAICTGDSLLGRLEGGEDGAGLRISKPLADMRSEL